MTVLIVLAAVLIAGTVWHFASAKKERAEREHAARKWGKTSEASHEPLSDLLAGSKVVESAPPPAPYRPARVGERRVRGERRKG